MLQLCGQLKHTWIFLTANVDKIGLFNKEQDDLADKDQAIKRIAALQDLHINNLGYRFFSASLLHVR